MAKSPFGAHADKAVAMAVITKILINIFIFICFKINTSYEFSKSSSIYLHILDDLLKHCDELSDFRDESIARILRKTRICSQFRRRERESEQRRHL